MDQSVEVFKHASPDWASTVPLDILVELFEHLSLQDLVSGASRVFRSWEWAAAESLFLCSDNLDLRPILNLVEEADQRRYIHLLVAALNRQSPSQAPWRIIIFPLRVTLLDGLLPYIAKKTPTVRRAGLVLRSTAPANVISEALRHWDQLVLCVAIVDHEVTHNLLTDLALCCKNMMGIHLCMYILPVAADVIVGGFPNLELLSFVGGSVSDEALRIVLDGCRRLKRLDIRHCIVFSNDDAGLQRCRMLDLSSDILEMAAHLELLTCQWRTCEVCLRRVERLRQVQEN